MRVTSEAGIAFTKRNEGYASHPCDDNGHIVWGYGHDQQPGESVPESVSLQEADALLRHDLRTRFEPDVDALLPLTCTQNQYDALCDFAYNLGVSALRTMLSHGWDQVVSQIPRWNHVNGVVNAGLSARRMAEVELFNS